MSYQAAETQSMVEGSENRDGVVLTKKEGRGLAALAALCLALVSFLAGRASSSSPVAYARPSLGWSKKDDCMYDINEIGFGFICNDDYREYSFDAADCLLEAFDAKTSAQDCPLGGIPPDSTCGMFVNHAKGACGYD